VTTTYSIFTGTSTVVITPVNVTVVSSPLINVIDVGDTVPCVTGTFNDNVTGLLLVAAGSQRI
jgi:hypothetical protein